MPLQALINKITHPWSVLVLDNAGGRSMLETTKEYLHHRMAVVYIENKVKQLLRMAKR
jgi:preprotein translocase subunit SecD